MEWLVSIMWNGSSFLRPVSSIRFRKTIFSSPFILFFHVWNWVFIYFSIVVSLLCLPCYIYLFVFFNFNCNRLLLLSFCWLCYFSFKHYLLGHRSFFFAGINVAILGM
jgi:hypothetical protein